MPDLEKETRRWAFSANFVLCITMRASMAVSMSSSWTRAIFRSFLKQVLCQRSVLNGTKPQNNRIIVIELPLNHKVILYSPASSLEKTKLTGRT